MIGYPLVFQIFDNELKEQEREVCFVDIAYDEIPERYYKESEVGPPVCPPAQILWELFICDIVAKKQPQNTHFCTRQFIIPIFTSRLSHLAF